MSGTSNDWYFSRLSRRGLLGRAGAAGVGLGALALVGCGDDDDDDDDDGGATPAATSAGDGGGTAAPATATEGAGATVAPTDAPSDVKTGGTLISYDAIGSDVFDPAITIHAGSLYQGVVQVYDYINRLGDGYQVEPHMAELPEQPDETTLIYTFKPGIKWQNRAPLNGRAFTAEDAAFGISRFREDNPEFTFGARFSPIDSLEAADDQTLRITTSSPFAPLITNIAEENMGMVSPEAVDTFGNDGLKLFENMIGTGAWMPDSFEQGVRSKLVRNPDYWQQGKPYLDELETIQITDEAQKEAALVSGQVDASAGWGGIETRQFAENIKSRMGDDINVEEKPIVSRLTHHFNCTREPFTDPRVRRALNLATNRQAIWAAQQLNHMLMGVIAPQVEPYGFTEEYLLTLPGYREDKEEDLAEARQLLEAAGVSDGFSITMTTGTPAGPINEVIQANWGELGVDVTLKPLTIGEWSAARSTGDFDFISVANTSAVDPDFELFGGCHSTGSANFGQFSDPEIDALAEQQRTILDPEERKVIIDEMQAKLFELSPQIWSFAFLRWNIYRSYVKGWRTIPALEGYTYADVWLDREA